MNQCPKCGNYSNGVIQKCLCSDTTIGQMAIKCVRLEEQVSRLTAELAEAKKEIEKLDKLAYMEGEPGHETTYQQECEALITALVARDVIIGEKDGALKMIIFHNQLEARKPMGEQHPFKLLSDIIGICDEALKPLSSNEVAEAVEGMREALQKVEPWIDWKSTTGTNYHICIFCEGTFPDHMDGCRLIKSLALYDKALKGVVKHE